MPEPKNNLSLQEDVINGTSDLSEVKKPDEKESVVKSTMTLIEKNGCHDTVYINAAKIFQGIHTEKSKDRMLVRYAGDSAAPVLAFKDVSSQRLSYELAFNALKYQDLLEEMLLDSCVYPCHSIPDELTSLLVVMLYDLQDRKFQAREISDEDEPVADVRKVEHYLSSFKTKLAAALARYRIKHDAPSIEYVLPEAIQKQHQRASALPLCVWINTFKISLEDVFRDLKEKGFTKVKSVSDLDHHTYGVDQHCGDVLVFPSSLKEELLNLDLFADCKLLLQDKSRSLAVHAAQAQLNSGDDIIVAHGGSHLTIAHMSVLTNHSTSTIFVCGVKSSAKEAELRNFFSHMECTNIQLLHEDFTEIGPTDPKLQKAKVILLLPQCSGLGAGDPIDFILNEHGDAGLLKDLFQGTVAKDKLSVLAERQLTELIHAMKFKEVQAIIYCTCSIYAEENERVVKKALESGVEGDKVQPYRLIPPVFDTCSDSNASTETFFKTEPSGISSGCFLAVLAREKDSSANMSAEDILGQAVAKGLLEDILIEKPKKGEKKQKVTQLTRNIAGGVEPKIAELLHRQTVSNIKAEAAVSKAVSNVHQKNVSQTKGGVQLKKSIRPISARALPEVLKHTRPLPPVGKAYGRQTPARKARAEHKRVVLKLANIMFPPAVTPYLSSQGNKAGIPAHHCLHRWSGARGFRGRVLPPPLRKTVRPAVLHPRPWM
ncbi:putative methyltransferase NSUN7 isoform X1 [Strigops habroptila]|uniref:putative methyltransferase NSUN7 isoform X1 n=2 Tax=Strigops habroptila TaxID=2489341 RepID=UPI0011CEE643|nr:putative methyltransferase NSUN7 isoform X1 [Strigops habroptila]XP_030349128.1 putative methyltransferase NSUN7 isoform X1 [Strigops habroptila]XP_030349129.1 putative methyltransferase NSUN7 isoform X1 [Strigops habroptila]